MFAAFWVSVVVMFGCGALMFFLGPRPPTAAWPAYLFLASVLLVTALGICCRLVEIKEEGVCHDGSS